MRFTCLFLILITGFSYAQHNNRSARDLQFRFGNPGARSLGFGGAFIGLADDATAPVANPAGMTRTSQRSLSLEANYSRDENEIPFYGGHIFQANSFEFDFNLESRSFPETTFQLPYAAVVFPKGDQRFGFFVHQQANLKRDYETLPIGICFIGANFYPNCIEDPPISFNPSRDILDLQILNVGGSWAMGFGDKFSMGASVFWSSLDYQADSLISFQRVSDSILVEKLAHGDDDDWGGILGLLWRPVQPLSFGLTYKRQPEFTYQAILRSEEPLPRVPDDFEGEGLFKIPDSLGFGISINPLDVIVVNLDVNRVYYSEITDNLLDFTQVATEGDGLITQSMKDVTEIHIGVEWVLLNFADPVSLRFGYYLDPYHAATNNVEDSQILEGNRIDQPSVRDIFFLHAFEEDVNHYAVGFGWTVSRKLQLDAAYDYSEKSQNATVSGIYRF